MTDKKSNIKQTIHPAISADNYKSLAVITKTRQVSLGAVVDAALTDYFAEDDKTDLDLILRRFDRIGRDVSILRNEMTILTEILSKLVLVFLTNTPEVPKEQLSTAMATGSRRYKKFFDKVVMDLAKNEGELHKILNDLIADSDVVEDDPKNNSEAVDD